MAIEKLTRTQLMNAKPGDKLADGGGLWIRMRLNKTDGEIVGGWFLSYTFQGKRREYGLGTWPVITPKKARQLAVEAKKQIADGTDPVDARKAVKEAAKANDTPEVVAEKRYPLREIALDTFEAQKGNLKRDGRAGNWFSPIELHVLPALGDMDVRDIDPDAIAKCFRPIWKTKAPTAAKAMDRLGIIMKHAKARRIPIDNEAVADARVVLGSQGHEVKNIPSMPWEDVPAFYNDLSKEVSESALCLRFLILTAVRSANARNARFEDIDFDAKVWTIPADQMKGRRINNKADADDFCVPLSDEAIAIIEQTGRTSGLVFRGRSGCALSDMSLNMLMRRRKLEYRPHGFRSSFRSWGTDYGEFGLPYETMEMCLAHTVETKVQRSYNRTDYMKQRVKIMQLWANHVTDKAIDDAETVEADEKTAESAVQLRA